MTYQIKPIQISNDLNLWLNYAFSDAALELRIGAQDPHLYLQKLLDHQLFVDVLNFIAVILPKKESICWAAQCCARVITEADHASTKLLHAVNQWLEHPDDQLRLELEAYAREYDLALPICWVAMAIFWHSGSIAPEGSPEVLPPEDLSFKAVSGAVQMASVYGDPLKCQDFQEQFIQLGLGIMN